MAEINSTAQAASALTGVSDVLSPVFTLWYLQKNITTDIDTTAQVPAAGTLEHLDPQT